MKKILLVITVSFLLTACPSPPCDIVDYGTISQEILDLLPYENQETYSFKNSGGLIVNFTCERYQEVGTFGCEDYGATGATSEHDTVKLDATYPEFHIDFETNKSIDEDDITHYIISGRIQYAQSFNIPTPNENYGYEQVSTVTINGNDYNDVYKIPTRNNNSNNTVYVDTIYYNTTKGILKLKMSNNEYYDINE